jgi:iron complex outermembrane recepter protein
MKSHIAVENESRADICRAWTLLISGLSVCYVIGTARADDAPAAVGLDEIVVTAQRREETLQHAAIAVDVISSQALTESGVDSSARLNQLVPSLTIQQSGGPNTDYFVRGVGNFTNNGFSDPALAFNLDGVYLGRATSSTGTFYDLERIELLKGPQGTLYGRNATAGAINVIPNKPKLGATTADVSVTYGNYNTVNFAGDVNLPVGSMAAFRVATNYVKHEGYNEDGTDDEDSKAVRAQFLIEPSEVISIRVAADFSNQGGRGPGASFDGHFATTYGPPTGGIAAPTVINTFVPSGLSPGSGLLSPAGRALFSTFYIAGASNFPAPLTEPSQANNYYGVNTEIKYTSPFGELTVIPAYRKGNIDSNFNGPAFQSGLVEETNKQTSVEARFQGKRIAMFDWLVGVYHFDENVAGLNSYNQYALDALLNYDSKTVSTAEFGRLIANVTDTFRVVGGVRHTTDDKTMNGSAPTLLQECGSFPPAAPFTGPPSLCFGSPSLPVSLSLASDIANGLVAPTPFTPKQLGSNPNAYTFWTPLTVQQSPSYSKDTYRAAFEYDVAPDSLLYASYETGYRSGGFSLALGHEDFAPETIKAFTLGAKNRFLNERLQANIELFRWKYDNQQVTHFGADAAGNPAYFTENIGQSTIQGAELEGQFLATETTLFSIDTQYLASKLDKFTYTEPETGGGVVTGCASNRVAEASGALQYVINCAGKPEFNSPKWSVDLGAKQTVPVAQFRVILAADTAYRSASYTGFDFLAQEVSRAHWTTNAYVTLKKEHSPWSVSLFVNNIDDERQRVASQYSGSTGGTVASWFSPPRTYGARISASF